jgi:hypothetical protein
LELGIWGGSYLCRQVDTILEVDITKSDDSGVSASISFQSAPDAKVQIAKSTYLAHGTIAPDGSLTFTPGEWVNRGGPFFKGTLRGRVSADGRSFAGNVVECGPSASFDLKPAGAPPGGAQAAETEKLGDHAQGAPVNVNGIALGMSVNEVATALKERSLPVYFQVEEGLAYSDPITGLPVSIPGTGIRSLIVANNGNKRPGGPEGFIDPPADWDGFAAFFTPEPGHERAVLVGRTVGFQKAHAIRRIDLTNSLIEKYGNPSYVSDDRDLMLMRWIYAQAPVKYELGGKPYSICPIDSATIRVAGLASNAREVKQGYAVVNKVLWYNSNFGRDELVRNAKNCGSTIVEIRAAGPNSMAPPEERIITEYTVSMFSPDLALMTFDFANRLASEARKAASQGVAEKAKAQKKPDL